MADEIITFEPSWDKYSPPKHSFSIKRDSEGVANIDGKDTTFSQFYLSEGGWVLMVNAIVQGRVPNRNMARMMLAVDENDATIRGSSFAVVEQNAYATLSILLPVNVKRSAHASLIATTSGTPEQGCELGDIVIVAIKTDPLQIEG